MKSELAPVLASGEIDEVVRAFPAILESLRDSYAELERRSDTMENELCIANEELATKVRELDTVKRHLEAVLAALPTGVVVRASDGTIVSANPAAERILGERAPQLIGSQVHAASGVQHAGEPQEVTCLDGEERVLARHQSDVRLSDGSHQGSVEILQDRTEEVALTKRLHATDKMAALGTLAAGVAHEIRNPLNAVKGFASLLRRSESLEPRELRWATHIVDGVSEADAIIENMLSFGSPERLRRETVDGAELIENAISLLSDVRRPTIDVRAEAPSFIADRLKMRQTVRNLIANAIDAQEEAAHIQIALERDGDEVVLTVGDDGPGIPRELHGRVLDPFFTTHNDGTGLGLALVSTIARLHGGRVEVSPEPSPLGGAEIQVRIPYLPADEPVDPTTTQQPS